MSKPNKPAVPKHELRISRTPQRIEVRKNADGSRTATGYFATYGTKSHSFGSWREVIAPGAFDDSLRVNPVSCFRDHNPEMLLGRTESGTLQVSSDSIGLRFSVNLPKGVSYSDDLVILLNRGDSFENSYAFSIDGPDGDSWTEQPDGTYLRTLKKVILYEGSILTGNPAAYPGTSVDLRSCPIAIRSKLKRSDSSDCEDGQHFDSDLDDCADNDDDTDDDYRCAFRCSACRSADMVHMTNLAEDDPSARSKKITRAKSNLSEDDLMEEQQRCAYRCAACRSLLGGHFPTALAEDDADARAQQLILSLRRR
jgi:HK97 family phage prohead protease